VFEEDRNMTDTIEKNVAVDGAVGNEGERSSSAFSMAHGTPVGSLGPGQRWSAGRKREVVLRLLRAEPVELLSRELGVEMFRLEEWRTQALAGIDAALKRRHDGDPGKAELDAALKRIGELTMENELLRAKMEKPGPLGRRRSRR
jgi:hypothetical protein